MEEIKYKLKTTSMKKLKITLVFGIAFIFNLIAQAQSDIKQPDISFEIFETKLKQASPNAQILDARSTEEYKLNHLKGSISSNVSDENKPELQKIIDKLDKQKPVFVYGINYGGRGSQLAKKLKEQNFKEVYELPGGISKWIGTGRSVETTTGEGLTLAEYKKLLASPGKLVLVDIYSRYCGTCRKLLPIIDSAANENSNSLKVVKIELFDNKQIGKELGIQSIPTLLLYKGDEIVWQKKGLTPKADIEAVIAEKIARK
jgi:thioredoxin